MNNELFTLTLTLTLATHGCMYYDVRILLSISSLLLSISISISISTEHRGADPCPTSISIDKLEIR